MLSNSHKKVKLYRIVIIKVYNFASLIKKCKKDIKMYKFDEKKIMLALTNILYHIIMLAEVNKRNILYMCIN